MYAILRQAVRFLRRRPAYTVAAVVTVALGVGVNAAVFQVLHDVVLRPLDVEEPERLVMVHETDASDDSFREGASLPDYDDFQAGARAFSGLSAYQRLNLSLSGAGLAPERLSALAASSSLLSLLGREPTIGRGLAASDDRPGAPGVVLLSDALWRRRFEGAASAVGSMVTLDGGRYTVVGVLPPGLELPAADVWVALEPHATTFRHQRGVHSLRVLGRLRDGVELGAAQQEMSALAEKLAKTYPDDNAGRGVFLEPIAAALIGDSRRSVSLLTLAAGMVLLVTCSNLAGLVLAQMAARRSEIALRRSLGAGVGTLVRQLAAETTLVASAGALLGALAASPALEALLRLAPGALPRAVDTTPNPALFGFSLAAALAVALTVGLAAGLWTARVPPAQALVARGSDGRGGLRVRRALVVIQVALAVSLASAAGLLIASFERLSAEHTGVDVEVLTIAQASLPAWRYPVPARADYPRWPEATGFYDRLLEELERIPGATASALALNQPLGSGWTSQVQIDDHEVAVADREETRVRPVTPGYFAAIGLPLVAGRDLAPGDRGDAEEVVVVNRALVRRYFGDVDPIGHSVGMWGRPKRIVGVVEDERFLGLDRASEPAIYPPLHQLPMSDLAMIVRADRPALELGAAIEKALQRVDPEIAAFGVQPLRAFVDASVSAPRLRTALFGLFGALASTLAAVGLYGVVASDVERRRRELGVRFALGARGNTVVAAVLRKSLALGASGALFGFLGAIAAGRALAAVLYRTSPLDPWVLGGAAVGAILIALGAGALPAARAAHLDPILALRTE